VASEMLEQRTKKKIKYSMQEESEAEITQRRHSTRSTAISQSYYSDVLHPESEGSSFEDAYGEAEEQLIDSRRKGKAVAGKAVAGKAVAGPSSVSTSKTRPSVGASTVGSIEDEKNLDLASLLGGSDLDSGPDLAALDVPIDENADDEIETAGASAGESSTIDADADETTAGGAKRRPGRPRGSKSRRGAGKNTT
ncbi:hypothetical protein BGZ74_002364, partial [Mortierella antarctica]